MFTVLDILFSSIEDKNICENTQKMQQLHFPCPAWRNRTLVTVMSRETPREILAETA